MSSCSEKQPRVAEAPSSDKRSNFPHPVCICHLTDLAPLRSDAVVQTQVVDLAVVVFYVQKGKAEVDPLPARHADLPLAHRVVWVCPRIPPGGQGPAAGAEHTGTAAISCRTKHPISALLKDF